jgi:Coenzyme PQQ synthesis protein D (PqqD)
MADHLHPIARRERIVVDSVGDEVLVYDLDSDQAHSLDATAAAIWRACDGELAVAEIADRAGVSELLAWSTLEELGRLDLLVAPVRTPATHSRRALLRRGVLAGAAGVAVIHTITAPAAAGVSSCGGTNAPCSGPADCCPTLVCCSPGTCQPSCPP